MCRSRSSKAHRKASNAGPGRDISMHWALGIRFNQQCFHLYTRFDGGGSWPPMAGQGPTAPRAAGLRYAQGSPAPAPTLILLSSRESPTAGHHAGHCRGGAIASMPDLLEVSIWLFRVGSSRAAPQLPARRYLCMPPCLCNVAAPPCLPSDGRQRWQLLHRGRRGPLPQRLVAWAGAPVEVRHEAQPTCKALGRDGLRQRVLVHLHTSGVKQGGRGCTAASTYTWAADPWGRRRTGGAPLPPRSKAQHG